MPNKVRYSVTLLSYINKDIAVNDELMIDKNNGSLYYKREDGKIIQCSSASSDNASNSFGGSNIYSSILDTGCSVNNIFTGDSTNGLFAVTEQTLDTQPNISNDNVQIDSTFYVSPRSSTFFVNVMTRNTDKLYVEMLTYLRNNDSGQAVSDKNVIITYSMIGIKDDMEVELSKTVSTAECRLNSLAAISIPDEYKNSEIYDSIKIQISNLNCTVSDYYDPASQREMPIFQSIMPDDEMICFAKIGLIYFTINTDTIFVDDLNKVIYIADVETALYDLTNSDTRGYINTVIHPAITKLYNSGLSTSSSYIKEFDISDWTLDGELFVMSIPKSTHLLMGEIISTVYYYDDGLYKSDYGTWDVINYKMSCNPTNKTITITTETPFKGKLILIDDSKFGDVAFTDVVGDLHISSSILLGI